MSGGIEDDAALLRQRLRDAEATAALARSRAAAGEVDRPPVRGFTDRAERGVWRRIYEEDESCS